jgi:predicted Zn-dependent peptidase
MNFTQKTLKNGLKLIAVPVKDAPSVTVLVIVKAGSKYENREINGLSHFLEHMCFKGTEKRPTAAIIATELDAIGSQNNAFTTQEFTGYYAKAHPTHLGKILDVVSDIYLHPIFDPREIEKEKGVIVEEINMYEDMPQRHVHDIFMEVLYGDQPAGWNIAGTKENVLKMTQKDFLDYRAKQYVAEATTVIVSGNFNEQYVLEKVEKLFGEIPTNTKGQKVAVVEKQSTPRLQVKHKETDQAHIVLGVRTFEYADDRNYPLRVLNAVLGGGMSSRLFQKLREEMGVGYYVRSGVDEYTDHGYLAVSTGVDTNRVEEVVQAVLKEMSHLANDPVPEFELQKAKDYMIGNMYLGLEASDDLAEYYGIQDVFSVPILTPQELAEKIQKVTAEEIQNLAGQIMKDEGLNMAIIGNIKDEKSLQKIFHF